MKLPISWLKEYVDIGDITPEALADKLLNIGFEVEEIKYLGENISNVRTGRITKIEKHPDADKLQVCSVDLGDETVIIVTAATNVFEGAIVPIALDGSDLPSGKHIVAAPLRGVMSYGMFCSGSELCIDNGVIEGAEVNGILILPDDTPLGADVKSVLGLDEYILDVSITANRPDCQSILGISREVAALLNKPVKIPATDYTEIDSELICPPAEITASGCAAYTGTVVTNVKVEASPKWMRDRLRFVGIRAINNLVDITNYVLMEVGQPLHAFDIACIKDKIAVRNAYEGEKIVALDGEEYDLSSDMMVIADSEKALAIAGVMGGEYSGINDNTANLFLEAAKFARGDVRTTSRKLGLRSDSSARYEKGVDWFNLEFGRARALHLLEKYAGKITKNNVYAGNKAPATKKIVTSEEKINSLLGITVPSSEIERILNALGIKTEFDGSNMVCNIPSWREDIDNYTDIAEEVIRYYGYDNLKSTFIVNAHPTIGGKSPEQKMVDVIKDLMVSFGMLEAATFSFINENQYDMLSIEANDNRRNFVRILNPLSEEYAVMRTQLIGSMLNSILNNVTRKNTDFRLFEIAKTYIPERLPLEKLPNENHTLCFALVGKNESFYNAKEIVFKALHKLGAEKVTIKRSEMPYLHPGISADVFVEGNMIGSFGKVHPETAKTFGIIPDSFVAELNIEMLLSNENKNVKFKALPKFPVVDRDIAVIVEDSVTVGELISCIKDCAGSLCDGVKLFDVYKGAQIESNKKSVAFSIKLRAEDHTLVDQEIQTVMNNVIEGLDKNLNAKIRA